MTEAPNHLSHKPIISVDNYAAIDGKFANDTDVVALSIGFAQYDETDISGKIWRYTGERWSRQSEELPLHRIFDLSILAVAALMAENGSHYAHTNLREIIKQPESVAAIEEYFKANEKTLRPRLEELHRVLGKFLRK